MPRLSVPNLAFKAGPSGLVYAQVKDAFGWVPNCLAAIAAHGPEALNVILGADAVLSAGSLSERDRVIIKLVISVVSGCHYCVAAHNHAAMLIGLTPDELKLVHDGKPTGDIKLDTLVQFVRDLAQSHGTVKDADFFAIKRVGYTNAQLVEISLSFAVTIFTSIFNRIKNTEIDFPPIPQSGL